MYSSEAIKVFLDFLEPKLTKITKITKLMKSPYYHYGNADLLR